MMNIKLKELAATRAFFIVTLFLFATSAFSQSVLDNTVTFSSQHISINDALLKISRLSEIDIAFSKHFFEEKEAISINFKKVPIKKALKTILNNTDIDFKVAGSRVLLFRKRPAQIYTISGFVEDKNTGERLIAATVYCPKLKKGTSTNEYGFYSISLPKGDVELVISYIGFGNQNLQYDLQKNIRRNIGLENRLTLQEIVVTPEEKSTAIFVPPTNLRHSSINKSLVETAPNLGGALDPVRASQLLAGVQSGADGLDGIYVRGGNSGHNQMMLDGVTIYIPYHLMGMYSVFNQDIINDAKLYTGRFPASYGGRLSSVYDIRSREGNQYKWGGSAFTNMVNLGGLIEGPLKKGKSTLLIAARTSHAGFLLNPFLKKTYFNANTRDIQSNFFDFNLKSNYTFSQNDRLYLSIYQGADMLNGSNEQASTLEQSEDVRLQWSNSIASLRWNHIFNAKLFSNATLTYSFFNYEYAVLEKAAFDNQSADQDAYYIDIYSDNNDIGLKVDFDYIPGNNQHIKFGGGISHKKLSPALTFIDTREGTFEPFDDINITSFEQFRNEESLKAIEANLYAENNLQLTPKWDISLGLRTSSFFTVSENFFRLEPRLFSNYRISKKLTASASFTRMVQYLHLASHSNIRLPNDLWLPSGENFKPEESWQSEIGLDFQFKANTKLSVNFYQKRMRHLYAFSDEYIFNDANYQDFLVEGSGKANGIEASFKHSGEKNGLLCSYAITSSRRQFEDINGGRSFSHAKEYPHQLKVFAYQQLGKRLTLSLNWIYNAGGPATNINSLNSLQGSNPSQIPAPEQPEFLRDYQRIDVSANYKLALNKLQHSFQIGVYNLLDIKNLAYYRVDIDQNGLVNYLPVYGVPFRPSLSYKVKF